MSRKVRAVVRTPHGCSERTEWFPACSAEAIGAMEELVKRQDSLFMVEWEYWDDEERDPPDGGEIQK